MLKEELFIPIKPREFSNIDWCCFEFKIISLPNGKFSCQVPLSWFHFLDQDENIRHKCFAIQRYLKNLVRFSGKAIHENGPPRKDKDWVPEKNPIISLQGMDNETKNALVVMIKELGIPIQDSEE